MTPQEQTLWQKIEGFQFDLPGTSFSFTHRLARENGWSYGFAERVVEEYKRFLFLCCVSKTGVTPSDQVDQAWHLHLTYTRSYWVDLCQNTLAREIHHNPTKGGKEEAQKFDNLYSTTLQLYKEKFTTPAPKGIWPDNHERFSDNDFQRVNLRHFYLLKKPGLKGPNFYFFLGIAASVVLYLLFWSSIFLAATIVFAISWRIYTSYKPVSSNSGSCSADTGTLYLQQTDSDGHSGCSGCSGSGCSGCSGCGGD